MWAPIFHDFDMKNPIGICATLAGVHEKMTIVFNPNYAPATVKAKTLDKDSQSPKIRTDQPAAPAFALDLRYERKGKKTQISHLVVGPEGLGLQVDYMEKVALPVVFLASRSRINAAEDAERFGKLDVVGKQDEALAFLKILEPKLKGLSSVTVGGTSLIHADIGLSRKIPVAYTGDGMARLLSIVLAIATTPHGLVLIDECENGIHHSVMPKVWEGIGRTARAYDCQVIGTTHSYEYLTAARDGFAGDLAKDFGYVRIDKIGDQTLAKSFDYESLAIALDANMEVR